MSEATYIANRPTFWTRVWTHFEIVGYVRAARELSRLGFHKEARNCAIMANALRD